MLHPSRATTIPDDLYFAAEDTGTTPQTQREAFVRAVTTGPVEQQLINIAGALYDVERKLDKRMENMMRLLFIDEMRQGFKQQV